MNTYEAVRSTILENHTWKAGKVAAHIGLTDQMGYDKAVEYVKDVRARMRKDGDLIMPEPLPAYAPPEERLIDVLALFELRKYNVPKKTAKPMLLAMCYWTMMVKGNYAAVDETMSMNERLKRPLPFPEIEQICNAAQKHGFDAMDEEKNKAAKEQGYPGAGLNWTSINLYHKFMVTEEELPHLKTIEKGRDKTQPWGVPNPERVNK